MNFDTIKLTHVVVVNVFILIYLIKTVLLVANKPTSLQRFTRVFKIPEMIISVLFLATGIWMIALLGTLQTLLIVKIVIVLTSIPVAIIAFKKQNKMLAVLAFVMIIGAYGMAEMSKIPKVKASANGVVDGQDIYKNNCQNCHGAKGNLGNNGAKDLSLSSMDHNSELSIINNGKNMMPAYDKLSDAEREAVATYVETLRLK